SRPRGDAQLGARADRAHLRRRRLQPPTDVGRSRRGRDRALGRRATRGRLVPDATPRRLSLKGYAAARATMWARSPMASDTVRPTMAATAAVPQSRSPEARLKLIACSLWTP